MSKESTRPRRDKRVSKRLKTASEKGSEVHASLAGFISQGSPT